jgi:hypothetical protein
LPRCRAIRLLRSRIKAVAMASLHWASP